METERYCRLHLQLHQCFKCYGGFIARHPLGFIIIPFLASVILGSGLLFFQPAEDNFEESFAPLWSEALDHTHLIESMYHFDGNNAQIQHKTVSGLYGHAIITDKNNDCILTETSLHDVVLLHNFVMNLKIKLLDKEIKYDELCLKWDKQCHRSAIINLIRYNQSLVLNGNFTYPEFTPEWSRNLTIFLGYDLGGVSFSPDYHIECAKAIHLTYYLRYDTESDIIIGEEWEDVFQKEVSNFTSESLRIYTMTSRGVIKLINISTKTLLGRFSVAFLLLILFVIGTCAMLDCVRSKACLSCLGVLSAALAVMASFGLLTYIGIPFQNIVASSPFLVIGIGIDDMFLMVAAWRKTDVTKSTEHRMKEAFSEAAVSITITSITDALAFGIGAITPFYSIRIFCLYTGVAVVFDYLFQITFFAGCMALMGYREEKNLHVMTCRKVLPKDEAPSTAYRIFCAGGSNPNKTPKESDHEATQHVIMNFFRDKYGPFLTSIFVVPLVVLLYIAYLGASIWGMTQLVEGLTLSRLAPYGSYAADYYDVTQEYFSTYGPPVAIVVTEEVDYSDQFVWDELRSTLYVLEKSRYFHDCCSALWLDDYLSYLITVNGSRIRETSVTELFKGDNVRMFLQQPAYQKYSADIVFDNSTGNIVSSRFYVIPKDASTSNSQKDMMLEARKIVSRSSLPMIAYSNVFPYYEQYVAVLPNTIQNLGIAVGAMFVVSIVMLPNLLSSIFMCFSLASIIIGIIGFMSLWKVTLDLISMINLIVSIGFTVDFSAHIIYAYLTGPERTPRKSAIHALYTMGMPISQAAISTILAILILMTSDTYIFICFFKVMTLVMAFGALHGLVFLPVFLMILIHPDKKCCEVEQQGTAKEVETERGESNAGFHSDEPYIVRQDSAPYTISERDSQD
ncbi:patched domain-containing protein 3-like isoform X1 [Amphiura filiformis]|uniref:patched domain-containing protein 3-like isoform X1 n=1 Tax=Amphiura filiformis TaxID=82378 RepID=UPI003B21B62D